MVTKVLIYRGIQGSGKTYLAKGGPKPIPPDCYFSADDYWIKDGVYLFNPIKLEEAHSWNFKRFLDKLHYNSISPVLDQSDTLIVDNTNITLVELTPYVRACQAYGLEFEIITIWCDPLLAANRNQHKVPIGSIMKRYGELLREPLPASWKQSHILNS